MTDEHNAEQGDPDEDSGVLLSRITIERWLLPDGSDQVQWVAESGDETPPVIEQIGMLYLALDGVLHHPEDDD